ncbi:MAG: zinc-dependent metalloprotease [bacterium]|nr:zinc-dependent metalloprotease [bacterium]
MTTKLHFFCLLVLSSFCLNAQDLPTTKNSCGNGAPSQQWENWFQGQVLKYVTEQQAQKKLVTHTIPVIVHVVHFGEVIGVYPNIDSNQIKSQIVALNNDFAGVGLNSSTVVPSAFAALKSNTGIKFCLAARNQQDNPINPKGIDRVSAATNSWLSPATPTLDLKTYMNTVIMPATIWDPAKYLNIWVSDKPPGYPMNGFATYPAGTGLTGIFGNDFGTATNDGIWVWAKAFGTVGTLLAPFDQGRTATHELGHWLGLRHIWGDGNCLSDYVNDTPWSKQAHYGCVTVPTAPDLCGVNTAPNGEMPQNFMDRSDDACMYMFTNEQNVRMQTALSQCVYRYQLGTHNKCTGLPVLSPSPAVASFNLGSTQCLNSPFIPFNTSSGFPYPTFVWSATPAGVISPNSAIANPAITISNPGTYTISLVCTNSLSSSTASMVITVTGTCPVNSFCIDTLRSIKNVDTLKTYKAPNSTVSGCTSGFVGYMAGTNCYKDKEFAQYFSPLSYTSTPFPQVNSVIVLFDSIGTIATNPATQIVCKIYGGGGAQGPVGYIGQKSDSIGKIVSTKKVLSIGYVGKPGLSPLSGTKIIPFKYDFLTPLIINNTSGFYAAIVCPNSSPLDSINIFSNTIYNTSVDSSSWFLQYSNNWRTFRYNRGAKIHLAIIPQITCSPAVGIWENPSVLNANITVMPNPGTGVYNLIFTLPKEQELNLTVFNSLGQEVVRGSLKNVMNNVVKLDLTEQPDGIYFAEISNGQDKTVKKIVLTH